MEPIFLNDAETTLFERYLRVKCSTNPSCWDKLSADESANEHCDKTVWKCKWYWLAALLRYWQSSQGHPYLGINSTLYWCLFDIYFRFDSGSGLRNIFIRRMMCWTSIRWQTPPLMMKKIHVTRQSFRILTLTWALARTWKPNEAYNLMYW
jgi:hypothetical protein